MTQKIYFIMLFLLANIKRPYWGLLSDQSTMAYFGTRINTQLNGRWLYVCFCTDQEKAKFDALKIYPDAQWQCEDNRYRFYGFRLNIPKKREEEEEIAF